MVLNPDEGKGDVYKIKSYHMKQVRFIKKNEKNNSLIKNIDNNNDVTNAEQFNSKYNTNQYYETYKPTDDDSKKNFKSSCG